MSSQNGSEPSSFDSEHHGDVARAGFMRMYVLLHSSLSPLDQKMDYRDERGENEAKDAENKDLWCDTEANEEDERFQLLYVSGGHYFHGDITLPDELDDEDDAFAEENEAKDSKDGDSEGSSDAEAAERRREAREKPRRRRRRDTPRPNMHWSPDSVDRRTSPGLVGPGYVDVADLPLLLPHFQMQQDQLVLVNQVADFRQEIRDVLYQMDEVADFFVEELSKDKVIERIADATKEFHWIASSDNPTFFELQTYRRTNEPMVEAGVSIAVMKLVVRDVLLDIIYHKDSYFVTVRENQEELALEDMFVPQIACMGPCFLVRRYNDTDVKQLLLWCALPDELELSVRGTSPTHAKSESPKRRARVGIQANDTQLYCLLGKSPRPGARTKKRRPYKAKRQHEDNDEELPVDVVFRFNAYVYRGATTLRAAELNDLARWRSATLPRLQAHAQSTLAFFGSITDNEELALEVPEPIARANALSKRLEITLLLTMMEILTASQQWVERFLAEIDVIALETANKGNADWLRGHLRQWLESGDGSEYFYELELGGYASKLWQDDDEDARDDVALLVWKGVVHQAVVVVAYRRQSLYLMLYELEDAATLPADGLACFGLLPEFHNKGRGYLIRPFSPHETSEEWLQGAKLWLWQTTASVAREELQAENARATYWQSGSKHDEADMATAAWFQAKETDKEEGKPQADVEEAPRAVTRHAEVVENDAKATEKATYPSRKERVGKRHHLAPLPNVLSTTGTHSAPWDLQTGRPI
ncbi:hypothetical protein Poli38472_007339 [Pythium oligandrum]|uniref:Uncharacterized protein n=1 Tax=Pythium oligandrum TaxID=41045 RepID=A0A8K1C9Z4_PYTOL|nr:hypothetical protein Poli38472_007339 [Pythium oligandrum]|eukprot:TMW59194.1 hypothetical protein Poli38472_007339 [Pythium oligandrum]